MTTGSSPPWARRSLSHYPQADCLFSTRVRPADCGSVRRARSAARSSLSQIVVSSRLPACVPLRPVPPACFALLVWKASGDPKRGERSDPVAPRARTVGREPATRTAATPKDHSGTRTPTDLIPPSRKRGGRSFGAALSEVAIVKNTDLFGRPCDRPSHVTLPQRGLAGSGAGGSALVLALCPTWALTAGG